VGVNNCSLYSLILSFLFLAWKDGGVTKFKFYFGVCTQLYIYSLYEYHGALGDPIACIRSSGFVQHSCQGSYQLYCDIECSGENRLRINTYMGCPLHCCCTRHFLHDVWDTNLIQIHPSFLWPGLVEYCGQVTLTTHHPPIHVTHLFCVWPWTFIGEEHRKQRKIMNPVFSIAHMREMSKCFFSLSS